MRRHKTYLDWLKSQITYFDSPPYNKLLDQLYMYAFIPVIDNDDNRIKDGLSLRDEYYESGDPPTLIIDTPCSVLELLVALARRMNYIYARIFEDRTKDCFWTMIENLGLSELTDDVFDQEDGVSKVEDAIDQLINRTYSETGEGGLFPLDNPHTNQRNVEIWYQMNQYLAEVMRKEGRL